MSADNNKLFQRWTVEAFDAVSATATYWKKGDLDSALMKIKDAKHAISQAEHFLQELQKGA